MRPRASLCKPGSMEWPSRREWTSLAKSTQTRRKTLINGFSTIPPKEWWYRRGVYSITDLLLPWSPTPHIPIRTTAPCCAGPKIKLAIRRIHAYFTLCLQVSLKTYLLRMVMDLLYSWWCNLGNLRLIIINLIQLIDLYPTKINSLKLAKACILNPLDCKLGIFRSVPIILYQ